MSYLNNLESHKSACASYQYVGTRSKVINYYSDVSLSVHISFCSNVLLPVISGRLARRHVSRHNAHLFSCHKWNSNLR